MKFAELVLVSMTVTYFLLAERIISRSPRWQRLAGAIRPGAAGPFTWRDTAGVAGELPVLERYFAGATIVSGMLLAGAIAAVKAPMLFIWLSLAFFLSLFAWIGFGRSFRSRPTLPPAAPLLAYALIIPWTFLFLDHAAPRSGPLRRLADQLWFRQYLPYTSMEIAAALLLLVAGIVALYYLFVWLLYGPIPYGLLLLLKGGATLSARVTSRFRRDWVLAASVAVQILGLVYFHGLGMRG